MKEKSHTKKEAFEDEWLTPKEAASLLKIHRSTIYRWANEGLLTLYHLGNRLTRLKRAEVEQLMQPQKQNDIVATAQPATQFSAVLEAVFMPLARKHNIEEQKAQRLMQELEIALGISMKADERSFDEILHDARKAFDQMTNNLIDDEYPLRLQLFVTQVKALLSELPSVNERRQQLVILLKKATRQWQKSTERATKEQVEAVKAVFEHLTNETPTRDDVMECADKLEEAGIRVTIEFGPLAEVFIQWADEGFPGDAEEEIGE